jgi:hypothetical protein
MEEIMEEIILLVLGAVLMLQIDLPKEVDKDRRNDVRISVIEDLEAAIVQIRVSEAWDA